MTQRFLETNSPLEVMLKNVSDLVQSWELMFCCGVTAGNYEHPGTNVMNLTNLVKGPVWKVLLGFHKYVKLERHSRTNE